MRAALKASDIMTKPEASEKLHVIDLHGWDDVNDCHNDASVAMTDWGADMSSRIKKFKKTVVALILVGLMLIYKFHNTQFQHDEDQGNIPSVSSGIVVQQLESPPEIEKAKHFSHMLMVGKKAEDQVPFSLIVGVDQEQTFYWVYRVTSTEVSLVGTSSGDFYFSTGWQSSLHYADNTAYFSLGNGELWMIDESSQEMELVKDLRLGDGDDRGSGYYEFEIHVANDVVYFLVHPHAGEPNRRGEIWKSDGTTDGTTVVSYLEDLSVKSLCIFQESIYFVANDVELWKADRTGGGITMVETFDSTIGKLAAVDNDYLLLLVQNNQVRVSDGINPSVIVAANEEIDPKKFTFGFFVDNQGAPLRVGKKALFTSTSGTWATQGQPETTVQISELGAEWDIPSYNVRSSHVEYGDDQALLSVFNGGLLLTDGTVDGTKRINVTSEAAVRTGILEYKDGLSSWKYFGQFLPNAKGKQTFLTKQDDSGSHPHEENTVSLWATDGTDSGTEILETFFNTAADKVVEWKDEQTIMRTNNKLWALSESGAQLLLDFSDSSYVDLTVLCSLEDGGLVMPVQPNEDSPLEFWSVTTGTMPSSRKLSIAYFILGAIVLVVLVSVVLWREERPISTEHSQIRPDLQLSPITNLRKSYSDFVDDATFM